MDATRPNTHVPSRCIRVLGEPGDLGWVVMAHGELYAQEYGWNGELETLTCEIVGGYARRADRDREAAWIAELDGERVGCVFCVADPGEAGVALLRILLVAPPARRLGLGGALVDRAIEFARDSGLRADAAVDQPSARGGGAPLPRARLRARRLRAARELRRRAGGPDLRDGAVACASAPQRAAGEADRRRRAVAQRPLAVAVARRLQRRQRPRGLRPGRVVGVAPGRPPRGRVPGDQLLARAARRAPRRRASARGGAGGWSLPQTTRAPQLARDPHRGAPVGAPDRGAEAALAARWRAATAAAESATARQRRAPGRATRSRASRALRRRRRSGPPARRTCRRRPAIVRAAAAVQRRAGRDGLVDRRARARAATASPASGPSCVSASSGSPSTSSPRAAARAPRANSS